MKRDEKRLERVETFTFERVIDPDSLYKSAKEARRGVMWKASVQRYWINILKNIFKTKKDLGSGKDIHRGFVKFVIRERGKVRNIRSVHFSERVVQKSLCTYGLIPYLLPPLITDNPASISGKGIRFSVERLKKHLIRHYRKHGTEGYALCVDFRKYFDSIKHDRLYEIYKKYFGHDEKLLNLSMQFIKTFGDRGIGLGSEISQISAVAYPNVVDHYIKEELGVKGYIRYMDDSLVIFDTKEDAQSVLNSLIKIYSAMGITPHPHKTQIVKLSRGFTYLKIKFSMTETGKIVMRPNRKSITRQRRKLKKFKKFFDDDKMTLAEIRNSYMSWRGHISKLSSFRTIQSMDGLFRDLYGVSPVEKKK